jgi:putative membrane protein
VIRFVLRAAIAALGLWLATRWVSGLRIDDAATLLLAGILLGIVNAIVRPVAVLLTLPLTLLTLGLFLFVINAGMLALVAQLLPGFHIDSFRAALLGTIIVGVAGWFGSALFARRSFNGRGARPS